MSPTTNIIVVFNTVLDLSVSEVKNIFKSRKDDEMSELVFIDQSELKDFLINLGGYKPSVVQLLG